MLDSRDALAPRHTGEIVDEVAAFLRLWSGRHSGWLGGRLRRENGVGQAGIESSSGPRFSSYPRSGYGGRRRPGLFFDILIHTSR